MHRKRGHPHIFTDDSKIKGIIEIEVMLIRHDVNTTLP